MNRGKYNKFDCWSQLLFSSNQGREIVSEKNNTGMMHLHDVGKGEATVFDEDEAKDVLVYIAELEAQVEKYKSEIRESCEDMRSEYRTCDLAHELGEKNKELEAQLTEFQKLVDETDDVKKILNNP